MKYEYFVGADPGFTGALAVYHPTTGNLTVMDMPVVKNPKGRTELNLHELHSILTPPKGEPIKAMVELVAARPKQGVSSVFRFGQGYGALQMAIVAHQIPIEFVTPTKWKKYFGLTKDKGVSRGLASQMFPGSAKLFSRVKDDGRAEAALIALYASKQVI